MDGTGTWRGQHSQFHPVRLLHHCTSAQHTLSFKGRFNPGISQTFEHLLPRFQPRPPVHPVTRVSGMWQQQSLAQVSLTAIPGSEGSSAALGAPTPGRNSLEKQLIPWKNSLIPCRAHTSLPWGCSAGATLA